ncbi:HAD family hydrolase [Saccharothrix deserti]|uniref:HAD family hydrolase n=1 Tax=Saccharothrix deserti TaxID=2593674 RepID=UPI00192E6F0A|nr:HAD hydrolase-like protein [Saccharothrix deserti]
MEHDRKGLQAIMAQTLDRVLKSAQVVLFDFDGPLCGVFAGLPAPEVARSLITDLRSQGFELSASETQETDPLEVLRFSGRFGERVVRSVEDALCAAELAAVKVAAPTSGGAESVRACIEAGKRVGVVSNNSADAVNAYLVYHEMSDEIYPVVGRAYAEPHRMKPNAYPLVRALELLGINSGDAVLIGDSITDVEVAKAVGMTCIAYANRPEKWQTLAGADVLVDDMGAVASALRPQS